SQPLSIAGARSRGARWISAIRRHGTDAFGQRGPASGFPLDAIAKGRFDGIFANASLFHVPSQELPRVLLQLYETLKQRGVLFSSNPRGSNEEGWRDGRYACFFDLYTWRDYVTADGFVVLDHYYSPTALQREG